MSVDGNRAAADTVKQVIALSTGIIALTITFSKQFGTVEEGKTVVPAAFELAWVSLFLSVLFGVWGLMAITGNLNQSNVPSAYGGNVVIPSALMFLAFLVGLGATVCGGFALVS